ncbi:MAG TPA: YggS family pyridoxal phosphate-dependent enzyme, partial [Candidatus Eisenbacteria bacterium]|nr:YggS family pyridoxal phosphate-dependent enzyme [Candidatus Eisenbacteria bacterium]
NMSFSRVLELAALGQRVFGENRVQEAASKIPETASRWEGARLGWRMIGHLQRNKVKPAVLLFDAIDSVDSLRLCDALDREAAACQRVLPVLFEFNCSGEAQKSGFRPDELPALVDRVRTLESLEPQGLMTMGPASMEPDASRSAFQELRRLRERMEQALGHALPHLSMGMSGDLEVGIEEGATLVRVGTALFGDRGGAH